MLNQLIRNFSLIFIFLLIQQTGFSQNESKVLLEKSKDDLSYNTSIMSENPQSISIKFEINEVFLSQATSNSAEGYIVNISNAPSILLEGVPDIPFLTQSFIIPEKGSMQVKAIPGKYTEFENIEIVPSKGNLLRSIDPQTVPFKKGKVYDNDSFYPSNLATLKNPYILRDFRGQTVEVFPVQYNPTKKTLRIYHEIIVEISDIQKQGINEMKTSYQNASIEREFSEIYRSLFLNYDTKKYNTLEEEGELLVITYDDFAEAMLPFVNWKNSIGRKSTMIKKSQVGETSEEIKDFIDNYYFESNKKLAYVLLVGDAPQIPSMFVEGSGDSDNAYGYIEGSDSYNEVFIGRFSAENVVHVETQVSKVITYERDLSELDDWIGIGLGVSRNEGAGNGHYGEADYQHIDFIRDSLLNYTYGLVYQEYDGDVPNIANTNAAQISQRINSGVGIINYCNHGSTTGWSVANYSSSNVSALTNVGKLPIVWAVACVNGDFVNNYCFAEAWLRATSNGEPSGAVGTMMSSINQPWQPPMTGQDEMIGLLTESFNANIKRTFGGLSINGSMKMLDVHGSSGKETHDTWVLFGDPTLQIRTDTPAKMEVNFNETITIGSSQFDIECNSEDALVSISYVNDDGVVMFLGSSRVHEGVASVEFNEPLSVLNELNVVVTGYNKETFLGTIEVVYGNYPFVTLKSFETVNAPSFGNTISLNLVLNNFAQEPYTASNVTGLLSSESSYVNISSGSFEAGTISPNQEVILSDVFEIEISNLVPDQMAIDFELQINGTYEDQSFQWTRKIRINAKAPNLIVGSMVVEDFGEGIPGILEPGETAELLIDVTNIGHSHSPVGLVRLVPHSDFIEFSGSNEVGIDQIMVNESQNISFPIQVKLNAPEQEPINFSVEVEVGSYSFTKDFEIIISKIPEYTMQNIVLDGCVGKFYDSGGPNDNYSDNEAFTFTINPNVEGKNIKVVFDDFDIEENDGCTWDYLMVFDGPNTNANLIEKMCGTNPPASISATGGPLTFYFYSDSYVSESGWSANFTCAIANPEVLIHVMDEMGTRIEGVSITIGDYVYITDREGNIRFETHSNQKISWIASKQGYRQSTGDFDLFDEPLEHSIVMYTGFDVSFNLVNTQDLPVVGAEINLSGSDLQLTNDDGNALFSGMYSLESVAFTISHSEMHLYEGVIESILEDKIVDITLIPLNSNIIDENEPKVFPNPFNNFILFEQTQNIERIEITNLLGQRVDIIDVSNPKRHQIITSHYKPGLYIVHFYNNNGEVYSLRLAKN